MCVPGAQNFAKEIHYIYKLLAEVTIFFVVEKIRSVRGEILCVIIKLFATVGFSLYIII